MEIQLTDKYILTGDRNQFILKSKSIVKEGKHQGEERFTIIGYFQNISGLINYLLQSEVREVEGIKTLEGMKNFIEFFAGEIEEKINAKV